MTNDECRVTSDELRMPNYECRVTNAELRMSSDECRVTNDGAGGVATALSQLANIEDDFIGEKSKPDEDGTSSQ